MDDIKQGRSSLYRQTLEFADGTSKKHHVPGFYVQYFRDEARTPKPLTEEFETGVGALADDSGREPYPNLTGIEWLKFRGLAFVMSPWPRLSPYWQRTPPRCAMQRRPVSVATNQKVGRCGRVVGRLFRGAHLSTPKSRARILDDEPVLRFDS